jgi:class 3 adenylate cyclase
MAIWPLLKRSRKGIARTRKWVTVVFTDIVDSTQHWHELGDIEARIQLDQHDRLLKAVVKEFDGVLVKTIGDSLMVTFELPDNAIRAAIAMQHVLEEHREKNPDFELKIRIGIHRGQALVEEDDVYGNTVNVAARVESQAGSGEIIVSDWVISAIDRDNYSLSRIGSFVPKGKTASLLLYRVNWWRDESRLDAIKPELPDAEVEEVDVPDAPVERETPEVDGGARFGNARPIQTVVLASLSLGGVLATASRYGPPLLVDHPGWASLLLNPVASLARHPIESIAVFALSLLMTSLMLLNRRTQTFTRSMLRGSAALLVVGIGLFLAIEALPPNVQWPGEQTLVLLKPSSARWVEVRGRPGAETMLRSDPSDLALQVATARAGERFVLSKNALDENREWLQIHLAPGRLAWLRVDGDPENPSHAIRRAAGIRVGEPEGFALASGLVAAFVAVMCGWWVDWRRDALLNREPIRR